MNKKGFIYFAIIVVIIAIVAVFMLNKDISKKNEGTGGIISKEFVELNDDNPTFDHWGKNFPDYLDMYLTVETQKPVSTEFGGNLAYSKLIRYPQLTMLWAGYPFSIDANEERGHFWVQVDQMDTARNNKDFLNAHRFAAFGGQPAACMNCHSGWSPWLYKNAAKGDWVAFNSTKYWTMIKNVPAVNGIEENSAEHSGPHGGKRMGLTCADCHNPKDMSLRLTRQAAINSLIMRGYEADKEQGVKATREEMRTLVCAQCHVEYYFKPTGQKVKVMGESIAKDATKTWWNGKQKTYDEFDSWRDGNKPTQIEVDGIELIYPWSYWKKGTPFRIEMFDDRYEAVRSVFDKDWPHKATKAPMLKIQHPEYELYSGGVHAANGVSCADCHMPYIRKSSKKMTNHNVTSPLANINAACKTCHTQSEDYLKAQIKDIQNSVAFDLRMAEYSIVSLITDIKNLRDTLSAMPAFQKDGKTDEGKISAELKDVLELHRKSQMRADFVGAENSTGFHNPREASRMLLQSVDMARQAQTKLVQIAAKNGIANFKISNLGFEDMQKLNPGEIRYKVDLDGHKAGDRYYEHDYINGNPPSNLLEDDKNLKPYNYSIVDKK
ncbi:ammonia-forming cytochrome c nitrite reductase subunit c552 [Campylobacter hyointestinalis]|uniref:ammonia-forming cytochrome c nitrite reductase subunit c552 n=1 Tax=Campylobacter hyointestinalis TaxID=198 RepID=UPI0025544715|nr:ammonia-forming cytochrome c nitrite reductase subunit c552 [Campylobacter hyointestinalis]MDL2347459.1 ammonia-forming cytochrome c nitrite reductase subunit c552 [Campylobacter hyointestinalis]MDL2349080.1 ammonia-forming cytochrome c nitrite reductase subunit c552 [Campylobacter hyointestinalis]MDL2350949.1 ammonia-forming cytochrome c nitrite reductase subunit c552 [Campylobacter hyointestinalis]MDM1026657.1 ammonia-forming cytochrome c nitrite reductase subunit c552 [Campylobacter hyoin